VDTDLRKFKCLSDLVPLFRTMIVLVLSIAVFLIDIEQAKRASRRQASSIRIKALLGSGGKTVPQSRRLRTIFGEPEFQQFVASAGANRKIELQPVNAHLGLAPRVGSHLFEEFTPLFRVKSAFRQSASNFNMVFCRKVSAEMVEAIARHGGAKAEWHADALPCPAAS
jgi:uncharacterized SAM-binding protein YcdF (DUF218 family)